MSGSPKLVELAHRITSAIKAHVAHALDVRVRQLETKLAEKQRDDEGRRESVQRQLSRHAEHLANLETKIQKLQR